MRGKGMMQNHECCQKRIVNPSPSVQHAFAFHVQGTVPNVHESADTQHTSVVTLSTDTQVPSDIDQFIQDQ